MPVMEEVVPGRAERFRMVAVDMDGTLLRPDGTLSDRTVTTLRDIHARGTTVCVASGRPSNTIRRYATQLGIGPLPVVCFNGACAMLLDGGVGAVGDGRTGTSTVTVTMNGSVAKTLGGGGDDVWFAETLDASVVTAVLAVAAELDLPVQYCLPDRSLTAPVGAQQLKLVAGFDELVGPEGWSEKVPSLAPAAADATNWPGPLPAPLKLIIITGSQSRADEVAAHARRTLPPDTCHIIAAEVHVEFLMPGLNKARGLQVVCDALGVPLDQVVAFGDANNDVEMLMSCGMSYAMPNGREKALRAARRRCQFTNAEDGVAVELEALVAEGALVGELAEVSAGVPAR